MVTNTIFMTMSRAHWKVAEAKAELSRVLRDAQHEPQIIENRGEPVAVVVGVDDYERLTNRATALSNHQRFLELSAALRAEGGDELKLPPRRSRPLPRGLR